MHITSTILITATLFVLVGCGESKDPVTSNSVAPAPARSSSWPSTKATNAGNFEVTLQPGNDGIKRNEHFSLDVSVTAKDGKAEDVSIAVDADMPAHQHGMNTKPELTTTGTPMRYRVDGMLFHMQGDWVITVDVTRGDKTERASFPVSVE